MISNAVYTGNHENVGLCVLEKQIRKWYVQTVTNGEKNPTNTNILLDIPPHAVPSSKTNFPRQEKKRFSKA